MLPSLPVMDSCRILWTLQPPFVHLGTRSRRSAEPKMTLLSSTRRWFPMLEDATPVDVALKMRDVFGGFTPPPSYCD